MSVNSCSNDLTCLFMYHTTCDRFMAPIQIIQPPSPLPLASRITDNTFEIYKVITVGTNNKMIRVPFALPMSERPHRSQC